MTQTRNNFRQTSVCCWFLELPLPLGEGWERALSSGPPATPLFPGPSPRGRREKSLSLVSYRASWDSSRQTEVCRTLSALPLFRQFTGDLRFHFHGDRL